MNDVENIKKIIIQKPLKLDCGKTISNYPLAYETYGNLNEKRDNAVLAFFEIQFEFLKTKNIDIHPESIIYYDKLS